MPNVLIRNTTQGQRDMAFGPDNVVQIPPRVGEGAETKDGVAYADEAELNALIKRDRVVKAWFDSGDLAIGASPADKKAADKAVKAAEAAAEEAGESPPNTGKQKKDKDK